MVSNQNAKPSDRFDPFNSRTCRQVRNDLAHSLVTAITTLNSEPVFTLVHNYLSKNSTAAVRHYLIDRRERYHNIFSCIRSAGFPSEDIWPVAIALWDEHLFFEVHEWLEQTWHQSQGAEKESYQAVIRAVGVYIHLEADRRASAVRLATKAADGLFRHRNILSGYFDVTRLVDRLKSLDPVPPKLNPSLPAATRTDAG